MKLITISKNSNKVMNRDKWKSLVIKTSCIILKLKFSKHKQNHLS